MLTSIAKALLTISFILVATVALHGQTDPPIMMKRPPQNQQIKASKERLAINYYTSKEYEKAAVIYEELYNKTPRQYYYNYLLNCRIFLKDYKNAERLIRKHKKNKPGNYRLEIDHAYVLGLMGNEKKSKKIITDIINNLPQNKSLVNQIASALQGKGYYEQALQVYEKARAMQSSNYSYNMEMARAYQYTGNYEMMFDTYLEHLKSFPEEQQVVKNRMQMIIKRDVDDNLSNMLRKQLLIKAQQNPDQMIYPEMLLWHAMQTGDFEMAFKQARAIDMRFKDSEEVMMEVADIALSNNHYELASRAYGYIIKKKKTSPYYTAANAGYFVAIIEESAENPETTEKTYKTIEKTGEEMLDELGLTQETIKIAEKLAHLKAFQLQKLDEAIYMLENALNLSGLTAVSKASLKLELANMLLYQDKVWDASLLYSQIEADMKNEPIGHEAKFRNAQLFYFVGEYAWSKTKLDILKSATSKLIANDAMELSLFIKTMLAEDTLGRALNFFSRSDFYAYQGMYDSSAVWLSKIESQSTGFDSYQYMVYKKADLMVAMKQYEKADSLYNYMVTYYPQSIKADNALFRRAELNSNQLNNSTLALTLYLDVMKNYPESIYAGEARKKYRELRKLTGDDTGPELEFPDMQTIELENPAGTIN